MTGQTGASPAPERARTRPRTRIALADDHTVLRQAVRELVDREPDLEVVAEAGNGDQALAVTLEHRPDVLVLDLEMPGLPTPMLVHRLCLEAPEVQVVVLSMHDGPEFTNELLSLGISGYLHKGVSREQLLAAVRSAAAGEGGITVSVLRRAAPDLDEIVDRVLSRREREVLTLVAKALSNRQIAQRLGIGEGTVKRHLRNVFQKLEAVSRIDAVNKAVAASLISPPGRLGREPARPRLRQPLHPTALART